MRTPHKACRGHRAIVGMAGAAMNATSRDGVHKRNHAAPGVLPMG